jgi:pyruvate/2-oxoacid:ferredoxin oxidoreductase beta subunit
MFDIGFQPLPRMLASGMNIKVFVLDTQVYRTRAVRHRPAPTPTKTRR